MPRTSAKSCIGCHVQGNSNITQDVVRAISILPGRTCAYVLPMFCIQTMSIHIRTYKDIASLFKNDLAIQSFFCVYGLATESLVD